MNTLQIRIALATFLLITTCVSHAEDPKRIAAIDYPTAQNVMSQKVDPGKHSFWAYSAAFFLLDSMVPGSFAAYAAYENRASIKRVSTSVYKSLFDNGKISKDDVKNVTTIIESGRTNHVDEMQIGLSREQFLGLQGALKAPDGTTVSFHAGSDGKTGYQVNVKYK